MALIPYAFGDAAFSCYLGEIFNYIFYRQMAFLQYALEYNILSCHFKSFITCVADKWLFSSMRSEMSHQIAISVKSFITYDADEWLFTSMRSKMFI